MQDAYDERHNHIRQGMLCHIWFDYLHVYPLVSDASLELASIVLCMFSRYLRRLSIDIKFKVFSLFTTSINHLIPISHIILSYLSSSYRLNSFFTLCHILSNCLSLSLSLFLSPCPSFSVMHTFVFTHRCTGPHSTHMFKSHPMRRYRSLTPMHTRTRTERVYGNDVHSGRQQQPQAHSL